MRRKERADCKKLWRPFSTGGEKREWIAGCWGDLLVNEERSKGELLEAARACVH
jgi:hypothetical protein